MTQNYESLDMVQQESPLRASQDSLRPLNSPKTRVMRFQVFVNFVLFACCMISLILYIVLQMEVSNLSGQVNTLQNHLNQVNLKKQRILNQKGVFGLANVQLQNAKIPKKISGMSLENKNERGH